MECHLDYCNFKGNRNIDKYFNLSFVTGFEVCVFSFFSSHRVLDGDLIVPPDPFF